MKIAVQERGKKKDDRKNVVQCTANYNVILYLCDEAKYFDVLHEQAQKSSRLLLFGY